MAKKQSTESSKLSFDFCTRIDGEKTAQCEVKKFYLYLCEPDWHGYSMSGNAFIVNAIIENSGYVRKSFTEEDLYLTKDITIFLISRLYESTIRSFRITYSITFEDSNDREISAKEIVKIVRDEFERIRKYENACGEFGDYPLRPRAKCLREFLGDDEKWTITDDCISKMNYILDEKSEETK